MERNKPHIIFYETEKTRLAEEMICKDPDCDYVPPLAEKTN